MIISQSFINVLSKEDNKYSIEKVKKPQVVTQTSLSSQGEDFDYFYKVKVQVFPSSREITLILPSVAKFRYDQKPVKDFNVHDLLPVLVKKPKFFTDTLEYCLDIFSSKTTLEFQEKVMEILEIEKIYVKPNLKSYVYLGYSQLVGDSLFIEDVPYYIINDRTMCIV